MKQIVLLFLTLSYTTTYGQKGFFLQPMGGIGAGWGTYKDRFHFEYKTKFTPVYNMQLCAGYQFNRLMVSTGIGYMETDSGI